MGIRFGRPKRTCNAAAAFSLLRYRDNYEVSDRLSIFANLCDYDYRLDLSKITRPMPSLSAALVALSLMNGDYSLLVPEVYDVPMQERKPDQKAWLFNDVDNFVNGAKSELGLGLFPSRTQLRHMRYFSSNPSWLTFPEAKYRFSMPEPRALAFPGLLWKVDGFLNLHWLREQFVKPWSIFMFCDSYYRQTERDINGGFDSFIRTWDFFFECEREHSYMFDHLRTLFSEVKSSGSGGWTPPIHRPALRKAHSVLHANIFMRLILYLRSKDEIGLADAIWNSIQGQTWPIEGALKDSKDVPQSVKDFSPIPSDIGLETLCELEADGKGGCLQSWMAWRIMLTGRLWYGKLVESSHDADSSSSPDLEDSVTELPSDPVASDSTTSRTQHLDDPEEQNSLRYPRSPTSSINEEAKDETMGRFTKQMIRAIIGQKATNMVRDEGHKENRQVIMDDPGAMVLFEQLCNDQRDPKEQMRHRRAFFDVNEPSLVVTPYQVNMELLPRQETRSMSISWVVQPLEQPGNLIDKGKYKDFRPPVEAFRYQKAVRGMWGLGPALNLYAVTCVPQNLDEEGEQSG